MNHRYLKLLAHCCALAGIAALCLIAPAASNPLPGVTRPADKSATQDQSPLSLVPQIASGAWFDPAHEGEGLVIEATTGSSVLVYWFTYNRQGNQRWFVGNGQWDQGVLTVPRLEVTRGGRFGASFDPGSVQFEKAGEARLAFSDCSSARLEYSVGGKGGVQDLIRLTRPAGLGCGSGGGNDAAAPAGFSGSWYDLAHRGEGFVVQVLDDTSAVVFWFTYRPNGRQAWLVGVGRLEGSRLLVDPMMITAGGQFGAGYSPSQVRKQDWGRLRLELTCQTATAAYHSMRERFGEGTQHLVRLTELDGVGCPAPERAPPPGRISPDRVVAFTDVNLVPMTALEVVARQTVLVEGGRIAAVGDTGTVEIPPEAVLIDARGLFLLPGLADMHVHLGRDTLEQYLENGVTTVRNMWGFPDVHAMQSEIAAGTLAGPNIYSTSPGLDASPPTWPYTQIVNDPSQAEAVVARQQANGWQTLKIYQKLSRASYDAIVASAKRHGMDFVGHTPTDVGLERVLEAGQRSIEHLGGYERLLNGTGQRGPAGWAAVDPAGMPVLAEKSRLRGAWNCPTLAIQLNIGQSLPPGDRQRAAMNRRRMVKALQDAGAGLLVGTDSGIGITAPGTSIHDELDQFVEAGLSPYQALLGATRNAAVFLGEEGEFGVIRPGARADLLLVEGNPLLDLHTLRHPLGVMTRGAWRTD